jgi:hypothetical protein
LIWVKFSRPPPPASLPSLNTAPIDDSSSVDELDGNKVQIVYRSSRLLSLKVRAFLEPAVAAQDWKFLDLAAAA